MHLKSFSINKNLFGENLPFVARSLNNIGSLYDNLGEYQNALEFYLNSLSIKRNLFEFLLKSLSLNKNLYGDIHPDVARSLSNIGLVY